MESLTLGSKQLKHLQICCFALYNLLAYSRKLLHERVCRDFQCSDFVPYQPCSILPSLQNKYFFVI